MRQVSETGFARLAAGNFRSIYNYLACSSKGLDALDSNSDVVIDTRPGGLITDMQAVEMLEAAG